MGKKRVYWAWDIEALDWDRPRCVVAISSEGEVRRWVGPDSVKDAMAFAATVGGDWVAHAGGIYDTLLAAQARGEPFDEVILSGSAVLCARVGGLALRDSFRWWLAGLSKVGQYCDKLDGGAGRYLKRDVDRSRIEELTDAECLDYCEQDCVILRRGIELAREYLDSAGARRSWTAGGSALSLLEAREPYALRLLRRRALHWRTSIRASECIRGARVECFARGEVGPVYCYDLKSAYPASYATRELGIGAIHLDRPELARDHPEAVWRCRWLWPHRSKIAPVLDGLTGCGGGWCEGWLVPEERALLEAHGITPRLVEGWAPELMLPLGQIFCRDLYRQKEEGSFFAKVFLNSLHGKTSEKIIRERWTRDMPPEGAWYGAKPTTAGDYFRWDELALETTRGREEYCRPHVQPIAAAQILGRTRARIASILLAVEKAGGTVYYTDTDSVHCSLSPAEMPVPLGSALGELAPEGGPYRGLYAGPKAYLVLDDAGEVMKSALKGMPLNALQDGISEPGVPALYRQARGKERGCDLRETLFRHALDPMQLVQVRKEGIASWATGLRLKDGWRRYSQDRTFSPHDRGKIFYGPTEWRYLTPQERLGGGFALRDDAENQTDASGDPV